MQEYIEVKLLYALFVRRCHTGFLVTASLFVKRSLVLSVGEGKHSSASTEPVGGYALYFRFNEIKKTEQNKMEIHLRGCI